MRVSRVYRPMKNKVYHRYHTLFDCNVVCGDFMGAMLKTRDEVEKQQPEYYKSEVKQLLGDKTSNDMITEMSQQMPWTL